MKNERSNMMNRYFVLFCCILFSVVFLSIGNVQAEVLEVDIACPDTIKVGSPLEVTVVSIVNTDLINSVAIEKALVGFGGNMGNSVSGIGLFGPFNRVLNWPVGPGATINDGRKITIIDKVPSALAGKVAMATVYFTTANYKEELGSDSCGVNVVK
jgi:hypothetical protein